MRIGEHDLPSDEARSILRGYAGRHHATVLSYDLAGDAEGHPGAGGAAEPVDAVTLTDVGRLVVIGAGLRAGDVPSLLDAASATAFAAVPAGARLEDWEPGSPLDVAVTELYDHFRVHGIGRAKRSKLLHLKRPRLVPIYDTQVARAYKGPMARLRAQPGKLGADWWEPIKRDLVDGADEFTRLAADLTADDDVLVRRVGGLTALRLLDILAWTRGNEALGT